MAKAKTSGKQMTITFTTKEAGLARQVAKAIKAVAKPKPPKRRPGSKPRAGGWDQAGGWLLDKGPSGPWGLQGGWTQGKDRPKKKPGRGSKVNPVRKKKNVRRALKKAQRQ